MKISKHSLLQDLRHWSNWQKTITCACPIRPPIVFQVTWRNGYVLMLVVTIYCLADSPGYRIICTWTKTRFICTITELSKPPHTYLKNSNQKLCVLLK